MPDVIFHCDDVTGMMH